MKKPFVILLLLALFSISCGYKTQEINRVVLPLVVRGGGGQMVAIYDCDGAPASPDWLRQEFGAVEWQVGGNALLQAVRCSVGPAVLVVHVETTDRKPAAGIAVVMHWADAPILPEELQGCGLDRGVYGPTNANGDIGFAIGSGAYYLPPNGGPHTIWIPGGSCLSGLGMLAWTNHKHLDSDWVVIGNAVLVNKTNAVATEELVGSRIVPVVHHRK